MASYASTDYFIDVCMHKNGKKISVYS